jgi:hypothetical protein
MSTVQLDLLAARVARDEGLERVLERKSAYRWKLENAIYELARTGTPFTADHLRAMCGDPPRDISTNLVGAVVNAAAKAGIIRQVGYAISGRVKGHGNLQRQWVGKRP